MNNGGNHFLIFLPVFIAAALLLLVGENIHCDAVLCNVKLLFYCNIS